MSFFKSIINIPRSQNFIKKLLTRKNYKNNTFFKNPRKTGSSLVVAFLLVAMILTLGLGTAKLLLRELNISADLLFSEKAYYAAESGVEVAVYDIKSNPVQNLISTNLELGETGNATKALKGSTINLRIDNLVNNFDVTIPPKGNVKFRFTKDSDPTIGYSEGIPSSMILPSHLNYHWKFICKDPAGKTTSLQNHSALSNTHGTLETLSSSAVPNTALNTFRTTAGLNSCFLSLENPDVIEITLNIISDIAPPKASIYAIGGSAGREKHIVFEYAQKNLSGLFDFSIFQTTSGF